MKNFYILIILLITSACGKSTENIEISESAIIGGREIEYNLNNDLASSTIYFKNKKGSNCSGILISKKAALTAAHCVYKSTVEEIYVGKIDSSMKLKVSKTIVHDKYDDKTLDNDIALILLEKELSFPGRPVKILEPETNLETGTPLKVLGFSPYSKQLKWNFFEMFEADITTTYEEGLSKLREQWVTLLEYYPPYKVEFAQPWGGTCSGDSGGPTFIMNMNTPYLYAINSSVVASKANKELSDCEMTGISTLVSPYKDWIKKHLKQFVPQYENLSKVEGNICGKGILASMDLFGEVYYDDQCRDAGEVTNYLQKIVDECRSICSKDFPEMMYQCRYMELGIKSFVRKATSTCKK